MKTRTQKLNGTPEMKCKNMDTTNNIIGCYYLNSCNSVINKDSAFEDLNFTLTDSENNEIKISLSKYDMFIDSE